MYHTKYLKYKQKYINLKKQKGGSELSILENKISNTYTYCESIDSGFTQHIGECWNDTIQTIMCFCDGIKESVQSKLFNLTVEEIIKLTELRNRKYLLSPVFRITQDELCELDYLDETDILKIIAFQTKFNKKIKEYIRLFQNRLCNHHIKYIGDTPEPFDTKMKNIPRAPTCYNYDISNECIIKDYNKYLLNDTEDIQISQSLQSSQQPSTKQLPFIPPKLTKQASIIGGIGSAEIGLDIIEKKTKGTNIYEICIILNILSYIFLNDDETLVTKIINPKEINSEDIEKCLGIILLTQGHATGFYTCNKKDLYYNDNSGIYNFLWHTYLEFYNIHKKKKDIQLYLNFNTNVPYFKINGKYIKYVKQDNRDLYKEKSHDEIIKLIIITKKNISKHDTTNIMLNMRDTFIYSDIQTNNYTSINKYLQPVNTFNGKQNIFHIIAVYKDYPIKYIEMLFNIYDKDIIIKYINALDNDFRSPLYIAVMAENIKIVELLLINNADPNIQNDKFYAPLHIAVINNNIEIVELLLENMADPNIQNNNNFTPLYMAIINNNIKIVELLLKNKANPNIQNFSNDAPLHNAVINNNIKIVELLLEKKADPDIKNNDGNAPLYLAIEHNYIDIARLLLEKNANPDIQNNENETPIFLAVFSSNIPATKLLLDYCSNINIPNNNDITVRDIAEDNEEIILLLSKYTSD